MGRAALTPLVVTLLVVGTVTVVVRGTRAKPISLDAPTLTTETRAPCERFDERLPKRLGDLGRRRATPEQPGLAAYGDPAVTIRCGWPKVPYDGAPLLTINGHRWLVVEYEGGVDASLPTAIVNVAVTIPRPHKAELLAALSEAVSAAQPFG